MAAPKNGRVKSRSRGSEKKNKEMTEIKRLKADNLNLKRQIARMRKQLSRVNSDSFEDIEGALEAQSREDQLLKELEEQRKMIEHWQCFSCGADYLRLIIIQRPDGAFYFRRCPACENRTRLKPLKGDVEGPPADEERLDRSAKS